MYEHDPSSSPEGSDRARRRSLFSRAPDTPAAPLHGDARTEAVVSAYQQIVMDRLEEGMRAIQHTANTLMHEIASEVWRSAGGDKADVRAKILEQISRDQALRSLIAHSDERFQALAVRTARLEDTMTQLAESTRAAKEVLSRGVDALQDATNTPAVRGVEEIRGRLDEVTRQIALAFETLVERDRAIVETIRQRVKEHGEVVSHETSRIAQAMQAYVQEGVNAIGQLASRVDQQVGSMATRDEDVASRLDAVVQEQMRLLGEQIQLVFDRMAVGTAGLNQAIGHLQERNDERINYLTEHLQLMHDRIGLEARDVLDAIERTESRAHERTATLEAAVREASFKTADSMNRALEARVMGLAQLVRSDSEALRGEIVRAAESQDAGTARRMDEALGRVSEALTSATRWMVEEMTRRTREETARAIQSRLDEAVTAIHSAGEENTALIHGRLDEAVSAIDRNMVRMADTLDTELERLARSVGEQASSAVESGMVRMAESQAASEGSIAQALDQRIGALAKMIRSDNMAIAERLQIAAEQETAKQALRSIKEMQASLPAEVQEVVDARVREIAEQMHRDVQATAESVAKVADTLERKVEQLASRLGERYDNDIQIVIDRMGDAMHALASLGKPAKPDRIELE